MILVITLITGFVLGYIISSLNRLTAVGRAIETLDPKGDPKIFKAKLEIIEMFNKVFCI
jgi:hypothetical protein